MINWHRYFIYSDGKLIWKQRPLSDFKSLRSCNATNSNFTGKQAGSVAESKNSKTKYLQLELNGKPYKCHRIIWEMHNGEVPENLMIDHEDGNGLNNKIENLRIVDGFESAKNYPLLSSNASGVSGVNWHSAAKKWQARITSNGKRIALGFFDKKEDAVIARLKANLQYGFHKNHGRVND